MRPTAAVNFVPLTPKRGDEAALVTLRYEGKVTRNADITQLELRIGYIQRQPEHPSICK